jgi:hypothetical protein
MTSVTRPALVMALAGLLVGCASLPSPPATATPTAATEARVQPTVPPEVTDLPRALNAKVTVTPVGILVDGQTIRVNVTGLWGKVFLSECATPASASPGGCGAQLAAQPFLITDDSGTGAASFVVRKAAASTQLGTELQQCWAQCVIVATLGYGYPFATAPLKIGIP